MASVKDVFFTLFRHSFDSIGWRMSGNVFSIAISTEVDGTGEKIVIEIESTKKNNEIDDHDNNHLNYFYYVLTFANFHFPSPRSMCVCVCVRAVCVCERKNFVPTNRCLSRVLFMQIYSNIFIWNWIRARFGCNFRARFSAFSVCNGENILHIHALFYQFNLLQTSEFKN